MKYFRKINLIMILTSALLFSVCENNPLDQENSGSRHANEAPETYLFLFVSPDTAAGDTIGIDTTSSRQVLHWWGEDPDGHVIGYYYQWDYQDEPQWTTSETDTFYVPIRSSYDQFTFKVWSVDDDSLMDPTAAVQTFPVFNSKPEIEFKNRSNPPAPAGNPNVSAFTFPTRSFFWDVYDPDGIETVTKIYYALDDTSNWLELPGTERTVTLRELSAGEHRFFVKAEDVAGAQSPVISFPDPLDDAFPNSWIVKEPKGDVLLVNDFAQDQTLFEVQNYYEQILTTLVGSAGYSTWEIGTSSTPVINPQNSLPYATVDVRAYLGYFQKVIWFSHLGRPNIAAAGLSLTQYIGEGGMVFITNGNEEIPDTTWTFTRIDSVFRLNPGGRLLPGIKILSSLTESERDSELDLELGKLVGNRVSGLIPGSGAEVVYRMEPDSSASVSVPYQGSPAVGLRYKIGSGKSIYFSLPLHFCDGIENMETVLRYILEEEFAK